MDDFERPLTPEEQQLIGKLNKAFSNPRAANLRGPLYSNEGLVRVLGTEVAGRMLLAIPNVDDLELYREFKSEEAGRKVRQKLKR